MAYVKSGATYISKSGVLRRTDGSALSEEDFKALAANDGYRLVKERKVKVEVPVEAKPLDLVMRDFPEGKVGNFVRAALLDPQLNVGAMEMLARYREFESPEAAVLAGLGAYEPSRRWIDLALEEMWELAVPKPPKAMGMVVVGAGLHAAIVCAARWRMGLSAPWVIEKTGRVGGIFACSMLPSFYLNSRNRAGELSVPGDLRGSLNVLPGAMVQPSQIDGNEYFPNDVMAWLIRVHIALFSAGVLLENEVTSFGPYRYNYQTPDSKTRLIRSSASARGDYYSERTIVAPGLGVPVKPFAVMNSDVKEVVTFTEFMAKMDGHFPLRGLKRVAVVGSSDSGNAAIEALTGQGPKPGMSTIGLDSIEQIDWYGPGRTMTCELFKAQNRTRYARIGALLPRQNTPGVPSRVRPMDRAESMVRAFGGARVNGQVYDLVVNCTGFNQPSFVREGLAFKKEVNSLTVGMSPDDNSQDLFYVGPAADIQVMDAEAPFVGTVEANKVAMWRYAYRTAALAESLV